MNTDRQKCENRDEDVSPLMRRMIELRSKSPKGFCASQMTFHAVTWAEIRVAARECGYALALHGSLRRDIDVIAVPWVEEAVDEETLVKAICEVSGGMISGTHEPTNKPHGRRSWVILFGGASELGPDEKATYIDLSVMPRLLIAGTGKDARDTARDGDAITTARTPGQSQQHGAAGAASPAQFGQQPSGDKIVQGEPTQAPEGNCEDTAVQPNGPDGEIPVEATPESRASEPKRHWECFICKSNPCKCPLPTPEATPGDPNNPIQWQPPCPRCAQLERDKEELLEALKPFAERGNQPGVYNPVFDPLYDTAAALLARHGKERQVKDQNE